MKFFNDVFNLIKDFCEFTSKKLIHNFFSSSLRANEELFIIEFLSIFIKTRISECDLMIMNFCAPY